MGKNNSLAAVSLRKLAEDMEIVNPDMVQDKSIRSLTADSRKAGSGSLFVAIPGLTVDGHDYLEAAVTQGCAAVLVGKGRCRGWKHANVVCLESADTAKALGQAAASFQGHPARRMTMIGITGTNGKTTTTYLLESIIRQAGGNPGVIGTVNYRYNTVEIPAPFTTPDPVSLHRILAEMADNGVSHVVMETSSHALEQKRVAGIRFDVALFTNLSRDHLDFHGDMSSYFASKKRLFTEYLKEDGKAVVICDDSDDSDIDWGRRLLHELRADKALGYTEKKGRTLLDCGFSGTKVAVREARESLEGTVATLATPAGELQIRSGLVGTFNLKNLLGAVGVAVGLGISEEKIVVGLKQAPAAPGRLEKVQSPAGVGVFVDFAHSPDALANVLQTMRRLTPGRLIVIFGCGGDRDRGKRPLMGKVAGSMADVVVLTSDNPRSENPAAILQDIEAGILETGLPRQRLEAILQRKAIQGYDIVPSRREAIRETIRHTRPGDVVLLCGKGHETYQITPKGRFFFDDRLEAAAQAAVINW
ncbi:MAG: UDP-N-acetylmuramoyl-L-alanyl-D-glutamate--2,6-diaminopimelate ligase [Desulfobulbaceae bacterium]|nr:UDP-N-acetylmuramoyl-L-alanyl-D-glutamate--2,6-diaminopimelate ligase [Desulfobulbaceae bacterium]HIJ91515.1 UDP-N-acetylmuramoyl-L-alanyl-D-glutamate--2,6-diaminopimelate ligase [Deltaproteobacteria bacterium]